MKRGIDTSVLVYAHLPGLPDHESVRRYLHELVTDGETILVITPAVLHEFVRVVTDPRRFDPPVPFVEALTIGRRYLDRTNVECLALGEEALRAAFDLLERHRLGRKRIADTLFAATLLHHGVTEIATCNPGDFEGFTGLRVVDPRGRR